MREDDSVLTLGLHVGELILQPLYLVAWVCELGYEIKVVLVAEVGVDMNDSSRHFSKILTFFVNEGCRIETKFFEVLSLDWVFEETELLPGLAPLADSQIFALEVSLERVLWIGVMVANCSPKGNIAHLLVDHL